LKTLPNKQAFQKKHAIEKLRLAGVFLLLAGWREGPCDGRTAQSREQA
jgi:hypothetical protein